jgi:ATP-dependent RNA helicase RhlB
MLSGDVPQNKRIRTLDGFKEGKFSVLVATDVAGRGIHVDGVSHVINFTLPEDAEDYVHRIGRTGRAGKKGVSISFACEDDSFQIPAIEEYIKRKIDLEQLPEFLLQDGLTGPKAEAFIAAANEAAANKASELQADNDNSAGESQTTKEATDVATQTAAQEPAEPQEEITAEPADVLTAESAAEQSVETAVNPAVAEEQQSAGQEPKAGGEQAELALESSAEAIEPVGEVTGVSVEETEDGPEITVEVFVAEDETQKDEEQASKA